jgi:hypothetical protein
MVFYQRIDKALCLSVLQRIIGFVFLGKIKEKIMFGGVVLEGFFQNENIVNYLLLQKINNSEI